MAKKGTKRKKGPVFQNRDDKKIKAKEDNGGLSPDTKKRRAGVEKVFNDAQKLNDRPTLKELCDSRDKEALERDIEGFFQSYYVNLDKDVADEQLDQKNDVENQDGTAHQDEVGKDDTEDQDDIDMEDNEVLGDDFQRPKGNTSLSYKSHIKQLIIAYTKDEFDISKKSQFPNFNVSTWF